MFRPNIFMFRIVFNVVVFFKIIRSRYFWPTSLQDDSVKFNLPAPIQTSLGEYESRYKEIKASRKLMWRKDLGLVDMTIQLRDREVNFQVSTLHAAVLGVRVFSKF